MRIDKKEDKQKVKDSLIRQSKIWKTVCWVLIIIHLFWVIFSSVFDIIFSFGLVLPFIIGANLLSVMLDFFGMYGLVTRIKTALLFYTLCSISFALLTISIEIIYEMRHYIFGQRQQIFLPLEETISATEFFLFFFAKFARIISALVGLASGGSFYIYRQAIVKQAVGKFIGNLGPIREVEIDDIESAELTDYEKLKG